MKLCRDALSISPSLTSSVVTIGNFDGMHLGHQQLIQQARLIANDLDAPLVALTFDPNPVAFFNPDKPHLQLQRLSEQYWSMEQVGVDILWSLRFNEEIAQLSATDFVTQFLVAQLHARVVVIGDDFRFGAKRQGDEALLRQLGQKYEFEVYALPSIKQAQKRISSSRVRNALSNGDMALAQQLLGRPYSMTSRVVYGDQRGREWGFPTANLPVGRLCSPVTGIFAVNVIGEDFKAHGVASVGFRPVFAVKKPLLEVFILDFDRDIYGQRLRVEFLHKIREEQNFKSVEDLISRIQEDVCDARAYFQSRNNN